MENIVDQIARIISPDDWKLRESGALPLDHPGSIAVVRGSRETAQEIVDKFGLEIVYGLSVVGDGGDWFDHSPTVFVSNEEEVNQIREDEERSKKYLTYVRVSGNWVELEGEK